MKCRICDEQIDIAIIYKGKIRNGGLGQYTTDDVCIYKCRVCDCIWHEPILSAHEYYESQEYRKALEGSSEEQEFYRLHDKESMDKFIYTGTAIFRNKVVADIGCGCGAFLDYVNGVAKNVVAVEPSETYRRIMDKKGFNTYPYAKNAGLVWGNKVDVVTSFDVIEHVEDPISFLEDVYHLLVDGGRAIIGTPTDAPVMRSLLGEVYEKKLLFSTQHLWIFSEKNMKMMAEQIGFSSVKVKYYQRYGLENLLGWVREKEPRSEIYGDFITDTMNSVWKSQLSEKALADYLVLYVEK